MFSSPYLTCISQLRECQTRALPPTSKHAPFSSLELFVEQKHDDPINGIIRIIPFVTATLTFGKFNINIDSDMSCIFCPNIISWRKVHTHELQLLYLTCQRGEQNNGSSSHWGLIIAPVKSKKMTHMAADFPAWDEFHSKHIHTMSLLSVKFTHGCFRIMNLKFSLDTDHSFPRYSP